MRKFIEIIVLGLTCAALAWIFIGIFSGCANQRGLININIGIMVKAPVQQMSVDVIKPEAYDTYSVRPGDCLWSIASKPEVYDNSFDWPVLWKANRQLITNPDLIYDGMVLKISRKFNVNIVRKFSSDWPTYHQDKK